VLIYEQTLTFGTRILVARMRTSIKPRKMPRQTRAIATRNAILEAAAQIISAAGLAAFNTNAVAERAGVSIGTLYQYFQNKDALMAALIAQQQARQSANVAAAARSLKGVSLPDAVRVLVRAAMQQHRDNTLFATAIDHEEARLPVGAIVSAELGRTGETLLVVLRTVAPWLTKKQLSQAVRTIPVMVRAVVDAWANLRPPMLAMAEDEAVRAVMGYLKH
jgi:AcrR family transcriptional regulator